jgi:hypothetical protein
MLKPMLSPLPQPKRWCSLSLSAHTNPAALAVLTTAALAAALLLHATPVSAQPAQPAQSAQSAQSAPLTAQVLDNQAEPRLASKLVMSLVVMDGKVEKLKAAPSVQPGDLLQYTAHYGNPTAAAMRDVVSTVPVPAGTQWVPRSEQPQAALASVDGRDYGPIPLTRKQLQANGQWQQVPVPVSEIRYVRWPARTLGAGESFDASLRVRVLTSEAVNASLAVPVPIAVNTASVAVPVAVEPARSQMAAR